MGRPLWFVAGAGVGVYAAARARRAAESLTAEGMRDRVRGWQHGARLFAEEVHQGRVERETELREQLGLRPAPSTDGLPELTTSSTETKDH
ncbi:hypothetical protein GCM10011376_36820 [Nocardioides flavus (ex Wang et al. 2016)]|uniref:Secreted protein n=1 Tax=Nocardioides flavus (ex Wang et al. 2016) TaxID=2058780 RepID=A0ABQ3HR04_9ACTN|nr:DUF6167 family protein [Nocardioides flavus (ex Wang et al. 2016)]GHE19072.1 hypothetical protein GCM10011376_36820 [Nocardioides flavus (ex Wang et al. 2016)]